MAVGNSGEIEKVADFEVTDQMFNNVDSSSRRKETNDERYDDQKPTHLIGPIATDDAFELMLPSQGFGDFRLSLGQSDLFKRNKIGRCNR